MSLNKKVYFFLEESVDRRPFIELQSSIEASRG